MIIKILPNTKEKKKIQENDQYLVFLTIITVKSFYCAYFIYVSLNFISLKGVEDFWSFTHPNVRKLLMQVVLFYIYESLALIAIYFLKLYKYLDYAGLFHHLMVIVGLQITVVRYFSIKNVLFINYSCMIIWSWLPSSFLFIYVILRSTTWGLVFLFTGIRRVYLG